jgi:hypothetical protein
MNTIKPPVDAANPTYYLDKAQFRDALKQYKTACVAAESVGKDTPQIPEYIGNCILSIARGLAQKYNFRSYSFVNDMVSDAVVTCIRYLRSYDPDRLGSTGQPTSALSYFTQTCHYAFLNRIKLEKKQSKVKRALVMSADLDTFSLTGDDMAEEFQMNMNDFIASLGTDTELDEKIAKVNLPKPDVVGPLDSFTGD